jgi:hypothetical protein
MSITSGVGLAAAGGIFAVALSTFFFHSSYSLGASDSLRY